jgi:hypothetical protein
MPTTRLPPFTFILSLGLARMLRSHVDQQNLHIIGQSRQQDINELWSKITNVVPSPEVNFCAYLAACQRLSLAPGQNQSLIYHAGVNA